jgi:hypothetical protein
MKYIFYGYVPRCLYISTKADGYVARHEIVYSTEAVAVRPTILFTSRRLQCSRSLDNHWPLLNCSMNRIENW